MSANKIKQDKMATMIEFCFRKTKISKDTGKILSEQADISDENKSGIVKVCMGKSLQYKEANALLRCLIAAMVIGEEEEEEEFGEAGEAVKGMLTQPLSQTLTQQSTQNISVEGMTQPKPGSSGLGDQDPKKIRTDFKDVCKFYKNGKCKFGKDCRQEHPVFCKVFSKHGLLKHNLQGCNSKCGRPHQNACRESLRTKECSRDDCRFYHLKGTKSIRPDEQRNRSERGGRETKTSSEPGKKTRDQVFLEAQQAMMNTLQRLEQRMERMETWVPPQNQTQQQSIWRHQSQHSGTQRDQGNWREAIQNASQQNHF